MSKLDDALLAHGAEQGELHYSLKKAVKDITLEIVAEELTGFTRGSEIEAIARIIHSNIRRKIEEL